MFLVEFGNFPAKRIKEKKIRKSKQCELKFWMKTRKHGSQQHLVTDFIFFLFSRRKNNNQIHQMKGENVGIPSY